MTAVKSGRAGVRVVADIVVKTVDVTVICGSSALPARHPLAVRHLVPVAELADLHLLKVPELVRERRAVDRVPHWRSGAAASDRQHGGEGSKTSPRNVASRSSRARPRSPTSLRTRSKYTSRTSPPVESCSSGQRPQTRKHPGVHADRPGPRSHRRPPPTLRRRPEPDRAAPPVQSKITRQLAHTPRCGS